MNAVVVTRGSARRPGAVAVVCACCGAEAWAAAELADTLAEGALPVCMACTAAGVARSPQAPGFRLSGEGAKKLAKRKRRFARRHGVPIEAVGVWPPVELGLALDVRERKN